MNNIDPTGAFAALADDGYTTDTEVARLVGLSQQSVNRYRNRVISPSATFIARVCLHFSEHRFSDLFRFELADLDQLLSII